MLGLAGFQRIANRWTLGITSLRSCICFPRTSGAINESPVTLPPGRPRLATSLVATGSTTGVITMGIARVAFWAAWAAGVE